MQAIRHQDGTSQKWLDRGLVSFLVELVDGRECPVGTTARLDEGGWAWSAWWRGYPSKLIQRGRADTNAEAKRWVEGVLRRAA